MRFCSVGRHPAGAYHLWAELGGKMKTSVSSLLLASFLLCFSSIAYAQNSQLTGLVKDKTDAVVPAAVVTLTNIETGGVVNAKSSKAGFYAFASIVPGRYSLTGEAPGFAKTVIKDVKIDAAANVSQDILLQVQSTSQSVNVESDPPSELTETTAAVSTVIDRPLIENMPLNGNSLQTLFELTSEVLTNAGGSPAYGRISNGQRLTGDYLVIDGASQNIYVPLGQYARPNGYVVKANNGCPVTVEAIYVPYQPVAPVNLVPLPAANPAQRNIFTTIELIAIQICHTGLFLCFVLAATVFGIWHFVKLLRRCLGGRPTKRGGKRRHARSSKTPSPGATKKMRPQPTKAPQEKSGAA